MRQPIVTSSEIMNEMKNFVSEVFWLQSKRFSIQIKSPCFFNSLELTKRETEFFLTTIITIKEKKINMFFDFCSKKIFVVNLTI